VSESSDATSVREALNRHGVFLKKAVLAQLRLVPSLRIAGEEIGTTFGETRVADIVTQENFPANIDLRLIIECKRVDSDKRWVFFPHINREHRISRAVRGPRTSTSDFISPPPEKYFVCSEGYEFPIKSKSENLAANQDPVFKAAAQLAAAFLGFVRASCFRDGPFARTIRFAPILITTARLCVATGEWDEVPLADGRIKEGALNLTEVDDLVLKHSFPTPEGMELDFRSLVDDDPWAQVFTESIYVVHATTLRDFLSSEKRSFIAC
jgi:hypothetical protein